MYGMERFFNMDSVIKRKLMYLFFCCLIVPFCAFADVVTLKANYPDVYVVKKDDTLWDISAHFLKNPWDWPKLWEANPQIANPHLIYPDDRLTLIFIAGKPRLLVKPHIRKSPQGIIKDKSDAIAVIDLSLIRPYLTNNRIVDGKWMANQPMLLGGESASLHHINNEIVYINGQFPLGQKVGFYSKGRDFFRFSTGEFLGQEAILTAIGRVIEVGQISKIKLLNIYKETKAGNRVISIDDNLLLNAYFMPKPADTSKPAAVLASAINIHEMGKRDIVYVDRGKNDGMHAGDVFAVYRKGADVVMDKDGRPVPLSEQNIYSEFKAHIVPSSVVTLPHIYHGNIMLVKTFDKMSVGIVVKNTYPIKANDQLISPEVSQL